MTWSSWIRTSEVEPSLYAADFSRLGAEIEALLQAGCRIFHFDVGDGHFVEPITMGPIVLQSISPIVHPGGGAIDVHLMVERPATYFEAFAKAGADSVTFHFEAVDDVPATIEAAHAAGLQAGVAFNPESEPEDVARVAAGADIVLCMSIHPGYSGQTFIEETYGRLERLRAALPDGVHVQVDGGVGEAQIPSLRERGVTLFVGGAAIFSHDDRAGAYRRLAQLAA